MPTHNSTDNQLPREKSAPSHVHAAPHAPSVATALTMVRRGDRPAKPPTGRRGDPEMNRRNRRLSSGDISLMTVRR
jgi:hypothetical protein